MAMDRPWPWTVQGHGPSMAMDCPSPWTVHGHGPSMAMARPGPEGTPFTIQEYHAFYYYTETHSREVTTNPILKYRNLLNL